MFICTRYACTHPDGRCEFTTQQNTSKLLFPTASELRFTCNHVDFIINKNLNKNLNCFLL